jgi:hypothetical protein
MTKLDKELAKLVEESGISQERVIALLMAEQAKSAGIPYSTVVDHEKYGLQLEIYPGKLSPHRPFSLSLNKAKSVMALAEEVMDFVKTHDTPENKVKTILRKAK